MKTKVHLILHNVLLFYLVLHNALIPIFVNLYRGQALFADVHFWFLSQIPLNVLLRREKSLGMTYFLFLLTGSLARLIYETMHVPLLQSWGYFSVILTELASNVFFLVIYPHVVKERFSFLGLTALLISPFISSKEIRSSSQLKLIINEREIKSRDYSQLGCKGSEVELNYPLVHSLPQEEKLSLINCGFEKNLMKVDERVTIINEQNQKYNFRLYQLYDRHGLIQWKFRQFLTLEKLGRLVIDLPKDQIFLLKSPENSKIGLVVFVKKENGKENLIINYDTIERRKSTDDGANRF